jgi:hypothetical protein
MLEGFRPILRNNPPGGRVVPLSAAPLVDATPVASTAQPTFFAALLAAWAAAPAARVELVVAALMRLRAFLACSTARFEGADRRMPDTRSSPLRARSSMPSSSRLRAVRSVPAAPVATSLAFWTATCPAPIETYKGDRGVPLDVAFVFVAMLLLLPFSTLSI